MSAQPMRRGRPTDGELVRLARAGRRRALDELFSRYQRRAASASYRVLGNIHDALEVCQEAFVRAYRHLPRLENPERFGAWLLRIVINLSLNRRRARSRHPPLEKHNGCDEENGAGEAGDQPPASERPGARLDARELAQHILVALETLPERQRLALILFSIEKRPQRQVAAMLGCSVEAVKWHVFQARKKLRARLADYL